MTPEQERALIAQMQSVLAGASPDAYVWPDDREVYGWRLIRWEADVPLTDGAYAARRPRRRTYRRG